MKIIKPSHEILFMPDGNAILKLIECAGRTCYKSEDRITEDSAKKFVAGIIKSGHHSVIEHVNITVRFVCDRGISHELVRHRLASYSQESSRYCDYSGDKFGKEITVIKPLWYSDNLKGQWTNLSNPPDNDENNRMGDYEKLTDTEKLWLAAVRASEFYYFTLLEHGERPEQARSALPNSLKTEIVMTANLREWKHVFRMRCQKAAHPQIREIMLPLLKELHDKIPVVFDEEFEMFWDGVPE